jgi:hypothetical protein
MLIMGIVEFGAILEPIRVLGIEADRFRVISDRQIMMLIIGRARLRVRERGRRGRAPPAIVEHGAILVRQRLTLSNDGDPPLRAMRKAASD